MKRERSDIVGVVLAGGLSRRMGGGDKGLLDVAGKPMLTRVVEHLTPQVSCIVINANGPPERFAGYGLPVVADPIDGFAGPLAGVLAGMRWTREAMPSATAIEKVARKVAGTELSVRATEELVRQTTSGNNGSPAKKTATAKTPAVRDLENRLTQSLGARVQLSQAGKKGGRIEIRYTDLDDLDRILEKLLSTGGRR